MLNQEETFRPAVAPAGRARSRDRLVPWLAGVVVVLVVAVLALGAMVVASTVTTSPSTGLIDRNIAAWNTFNGDTIRSVYTDDAFMFTSADSKAAATGVDEIVSLAQWGGYTITRLGPVTERGALVWYPIHVSTNYDVSGSDAISVIELRDGKIAQHWVIWSD